MDCIMTWDHYSDTGRTCAMEYKLAEYGIPSLFNKYSASTCNSYVLTAQGHYSLANLHLFFVSFYIVTFEYV